jgi:hypothetical protein
MKYFYIFIFLISALSLQFVSTHQNDNVDQSQKRYTVPLNFNDAFVQLTEKLKYENGTRMFSEFFHYDSWTQIKNHIDSIHESSFDFIFPNISKPCSENVKYLMIQLKLKSEWALRGLFNKINLKNSF